MRVNQTNRLVNCGQSPADNVWNNVRISFLSRVFWPLIQWAAFRTARPVCPPFRQIRTRPVAHKSTPDLMTNCTYSVAEHIVNFLSMWIALEHLSCCCCTRTWPCAGHSYWLRFSFIGFALFEIEQRFLPRRLKVRASRSVQTTLGTHNTLKNNRTVAAILVVCLS